MISLTTITKTLLLYLIICFLLLEAETQNVQLNMKAKFFGRIIQNRLDNKMHTFPTIGVKL